MNQKRYAYLIGANGPQTEHVKALKYAHRDAQRLAEALLAPPCAFTKAEWTIAESPQPTLAGLNRLIKQCEPSDLLLVHFSGHGNYEGQLFLVCNGTDIDDCLSSAIKVEDIKAYLDKCKARHKVLILDCCHAGGAYTGPFKGDESIKSTLQQSLGSSCAILSACSQAKTTRELDALDDGEGAGFLSWAVTTACTSRFQEVTKGSNALSLMDIWHWMPTALEEANSSLKPGEEKLHLPILVNEMTPGHDGEIWLTEQRRASTPKFAPNDQLTRKKYLESVYKRYNSVTLPLGPAEGISLHAVFQPLELCRDPLAAEDLDRKKRRPLLGERLEDEKDADRFQSHRHEKERADEKQRPVIAKNGEDALTKSPQRRVVILGGPGTGKTTTLKHLTGCRAKEALTDPNAPIPIFLSLADLARSQKTLQSYLVDLVEELGVERIYAETLWKAIQAGQAFACLDSLDEVEPRHQRRQKMIEWVNAWAAESGNTWVIGSRFTEYKGGSFKHGRFAEWELLPMDHQLRLELAERLLSELQQLLKSAPKPSQSPATFVKLLEDHPQAAAWGENPLLFSLAAVVFLRTGELPASRAMLYREVIDAIFETREADLVRRKVLRHVLSDLALEFYKTKGRTFSLDDLLDRLPIIRQRRHENWITEEIARRIINSGLLDVLARETYSFRHQTFQEYLAAVELAQQLTHQDQTVREKAREFAWGKRTYSRWTEVLRLMVGVLYQQPGHKGKIEAEHWLQKLIGQRSTEEGDPGNLGLALALKSLAEIAERDEREPIKTAQLEKDILSTWLEEFLQAARLQRKAKQERLQSLTRDIFHQHGQEVDKILEHLIKTLWSHNINERESACELLRELGQRVPIQQLLVALNDPDARIRVVAVRSLGGQGEHVPLEHLLDALHDKDWLVRWEVVRALGKLGERVPLEYLIDALHDQDENVRMEAVTALGKQRERVPLDRLLDALHDNNRFIRREAVRALGEQGERVPLEYLIDA
jgi:MoxR-like ATPase